MITLSDRREHYYRLILGSLVGQRVTLTLRPWRGVAFEVTGRCLSDHLIADDGREYSFSQFVIESFR